MRFAYMPSGCISRANVHKCILQCVCATSALRDNDNCKHTRTHQHRICMHTYYFSEQIHYVRYSIICARNNEMRSAKLYTRIEKRSSITTRYTNGVCRHVNPLSRRCSSNIAPHHYVQCTYSENRVIVYFKEYEI